MDFYARLVDKKEAKQIKKTKVLGDPYSKELVPAFKATTVLGILYELKPDQIKELHVLMGGSGSARYIIIFRPKTSPLVKDIPFRKSDEIKKFLGFSIAESKFEPVTLLEEIILI